MAVATLMRHDERYSASLRKKEYDEGDFPLLARPLRFAVTGGFAALIQLALLTLLTHAGWAPLSANALAFLLAAQVNFIMSSRFTWRDRRESRPHWQRWAWFHISISGMAVLNMGVFAIAVHIVPTLVASALGIGFAALGNFFLGDRIVFRAHRTQLDTLRDAA